MTLSSSQIDEIVDELCPRAPVWRADPARAGGRRVVDNRGKLFTHAFSGKIAEDVGNAPVAVIGGIYMCSDSKMRTLGWSAIKHGASDGNASGDDLLKVGTQTGGSFLISGCVLDSSHDAIAPGKGEESNRAKTTYVIEHCYGRAIRDEFHENDACLSGEMYDNLVDSTWMFVSMRNPNNEHKFPHTAHTKLVRQYVRFAAQPDPRSNRSGAGPGYGGGGQIFKSGKKTGSANYEQCLFLWECRHNATNEGQGFRPGSYKSVYVLYAPIVLEAGQRRPRPQPFFMSLPGGVTDLGRHDNAYDVWLAVRDRWLNQHDCRPKDDYFGFTLRQGQAHPAFPNLGPVKDTWGYSYGPGKIDVPDEPPPPPPPPPDNTLAKALDRMDAAISGLRAGTDVLLAELPSGNLARAGKNTGLKNAHALENACAEIAELTDLGIEDFLVGLGPKPKLIEMTECAEAFANRAVALAAKLDANDAPGARAEIKPELTEQAEALASLVRAEALGELGNGDGNGDKNGNGNGDGNGNGNGDGPDLEELREQLREVKAAVERAMEIAGE